jgi:hypothetical protein
MICAYVLQPQNTHMDLNIGTAFWFASRAVGYVRSYSLGEVEASYLAEEHGRPLLRSGGEGARRGDGRKKEEEEAKPKRSRRKVKQVEAGAGASALVGEDDRPESELGQGTEEAEKSPCSRHNCKRIAKPGCPHRLCKMCCDRRHRSSVLTVDAVSSSEYAMMMSVGMDVSQSGEGGCVQRECPVHRQLKKKAAGSAEEGSVGGVREVAIESRPQEEDGEVAGVDRESYTSSCKVLLVGIGADEQLAGYARHRSVYLQGGEEALLREIQMDTARIWQRNLGRDDRCVCDHGREAWFPFLDELVVDFINRTPLNEVP